MTETDSGGYEAEARGATGVIADGQTAQAVFSNHKDKPAESEPSDDTSVPEPSDVSDSSSVSSEAPGRFGVLRREQYALHRRCADDGCVHGAAAALRMRGRADGAQKRPRRISVMLCRPYSDASAVESAA